MTHESFPMPKTRQDGRKVWLVCNPNSGSNDEAALTEVRDAFAGSGFALERLVRFPDDDAPTPGELDAAGVDMLSVFAGDGTTHAVVAAAKGWGGALLVLPGGTMNMLCKRLHGDADAVTIISRLVPGQLEVSRPTVIRTAYGDALSGALAGPGTVWNEVREAMRALDVVEFVSSTREAISHSANGPKVVCAEANCGREEGYAAITVTPQDDGLQANGYYAESLADFAGQGIALLNRNFRDGPHDDLGLHPSLRLICPAGEKMGLLLDGEPFDGQAEEVFATVPCEVDLVKTKDA